MTNNLETSVKTARENLDSHVREMVEWHFNPETGSPFWLEKAETYDFNPREDVTCFADLKKFPLFEDDWLRGGPVRRWLPKGYAGKGMYVFETGARPASRNRGSLSTTFASTMKCFRKPYQMNRSHAERTG